MTDLNDWIKERREIHASAVEEAARAIWDNDDPEGESPNENFEDEPKWSQERYRQSAKAALEASCVSATLPALLTAVEKVLELHRPDTVYAWAEDCTDPESHHMFTDVRSGDMLCEDEPIGRFCAGCVPENDTTIDVDEYSWPCETVRAIEEAINE